MAEARVKMATMLLTGDVNLMNVDDAKIPFARVTGELGKADVIFSNLECCLVETPADHSSGSRPLDSSR